MAKPLLRPNYLWETPSMVFDAIDRVPRKAKPRFFAILGLMTGQTKSSSRQSIADMYGISRRQLQRWIHRYNKGGIIGLAPSIPLRPGRRPKISHKVFNETLLPALVEARLSNPDGFCGASLHRLVNEKMGLKIGCSTLMRILRGQGIELTGGARTKRSNPASPDQPA